MIFSKFSFYAYFTAFFCLAQSQYSQIIEKQYRLDSLQTKIIQIDEKKVIVSSSIQLFTDSIQLLINKDFQFNSYRKQIQLFQKPKHGLYLRLKYKRLTLSSYKQKHSLPNIIPFEFFRSKDDSIKTTFIFSKSNPQTDYFSKISKSGSIYRGFKIGTSNNLNLESGMNISLNGQISKKFHIQATLTDESIPIQPEGTSQRLSDVDKIYIHLKSPFGTALIGDFNVNMKGNNLFNYQRRLKGLNLNYHSKSFKVEGIISSSRAIFKTNKFLTKEGLQGPYKLKGENNSNDIVIIAGSEKIYLDGIKMKRGSRNDYIIEYSNGSIYFTSKQLIHANQRVEIDFEYVGAQQRFGRNISLTEINFRKPSFRLRSRFMQESDDTDSPLSGSTEFSRAQIKLIENAGNDISKATQSGIKLAKNNDGYYKKIYNTTILDSILVYDSAKKSPYYVTFSSVPMGIGAYKRISRFQNEYEYVGIGNGDYNPIIFLSLASKKQLLITQLIYNYKGENSFELSHALSNFDANKLSFIDDKKTTGHYLKFKQKHYEKKLFFLNNFSFEQDFEIYEKNFKTLNKFYRPDFLTRWGILPLVRQNSRIRYQNNISFSISDNDDSRIGIAFINERKNANAFRIKFAENIKFKNNIPDLNFRTFLRHTEQNALSETNQRSEISGQLGKKYHKILYQLSYKHKRYKRKNNVFDKRFLNHKGTVKFQYFFKKNHSISFKYSAEKNTVYDSLSKDYRNFENTSGQIIKYIFHAKSFQNKTLLSLQTRKIDPFFSHLVPTEKYRFFDLAFQDTSYNSQNSYLIESESQYKVNSFKIRLNYQARSELAPFKDVIYHKVTQGLGQFRLDKTLNQYVQDNIRGDYLRFIIPNGRFEPISKVRVELNSYFSPRKLRSRSFLYKILSPFEFKSRFFLFDKTRNPNTPDIYLLRPSALLGDQSLDGRLEFYQNIYINRSNLKLHFSLDYKHLSNITNDIVDKFNNLNYLSRKNILQGQVFWKISKKINSVSKLSFETFNKRNKNRSDLNRNIKSFQIDENIYYFPSKNLNISFESTYKNQVNDEAATPIRVQIHDLMLNFNYSWLTKGYINGNMTSSTVRVLKNANKIYIPNELADGKKEGLNLSWSLSASYNFLQNVTVNLQYNGRKFIIDSDIFHLFRMEMRLNL